MVRQAEREAERSQESAARVSKTLGYGAALVATLLGLATFVAGAVAAEKVAPIDRRVTTLEAQRAEDAKKLDEVAKDVKEILKAVK